MDSHTASPKPPGLFWVLLAVFTMLAVDAGYRLVKLAGQRRQLGQAQLVQAQNVGRLGPALAQQPLIEARLQALSLDLLQIARTNLAARQIVQEFNIQWTPGTAPEPTPTGK